MSDALRALNDGAMEFDSVSGIDDPEQQTAPEQPEVQEGYEPEAPEEGAGEEPESPDQPQEPEVRPQDRKGKKSSAKDWAEREKRRADKAANDLRARDSQIAEMQRQFAQQQAEIAKLNRQIKLEGNPQLKHAARLLEEGWKPENVEAEAARKEAQGDQEGADIARQIAMHMRNLEKETAQSQEAQQAQQAETAWRNIPYGTTEFDNAVGQLKPGTEEFNQAWAFVEQNLVKVKSSSQDPWDQECARQFSDPKSEFGQRLNYFFRNTAFGKEVGKHAEGVILAFDICKMSMIIDHQAAELRKLREENEAYRGATSPSSGMPVNGESYRPSLPDPRQNRDGFLAGFERLGTDEMRRVLRSREAA